MLHPRIQEVTERVIERSKATRQAYLARIQQAKKQTRVRAGLARNLAHVMAACSSSDKARLKEDEQPKLGIIAPITRVIGA